MTAEHVNGVKVIDVLLAESPVKTPTGRTIHFKRMVELVLEDGSTVYGCTECDYTDSALGRIRSHLSREHWTRPVPRKVTGGARRSRPAATVDVAGLSVADLLNSAATQIEALNDALQRVAEDRNTWKARALKAERAMAKLKGLLS